MPNESIKSQDIEEDLGADSETEEFKLGMTTIILGILLTIITITFFYLLGSKTGADFGFREIIFAVVLALTLTAILRWVKFFITKNRYLGLVIGLLITGGGAFSLSQRYSGPNTKIFSIITSLIVLAYLFIHFWKSSKQTSS
tara:strand:+ start:1223 stop:1648 length:426 start_codon:yes stop_codon:yes gene_type:complete